VNGWGKSRARALNPTYDIVADSLDVHMPDQHLREIRALREAFAQSVPDTTRVHTAEHDWLRGDTIFAFFDTTARPAGDTASQPQLHELRSAGDASSFYQIAPKDTAAVSPAMNYVRGEQITVHFANREVQNVNIIGKAAGVYLDPLPRTPTDSTRRDTTARAAPALTPPSNTPRPPSGRTP